MLNDIPYDIGSLIGYSTLNNEDKKLEPFIDLSISQHELAQHEHIVNKVFQEEFLNHVVKSLESVIGKTHSIEFWNVAISPWLMWLVQTCYMNFIQLEKFIEHHGGQESTIKLVFDVPFNPPPETSTELFGILQKREFHVWIVSMYLQDCLPKNWTITILKGQIIVLSKPRVSLWSNLKSLVRQHLSNLRCTSDEIPLGWRFVFSLVLTFKKFNHHDKKILSQTIKTDGDKLISENFITITKLIIDQCIPLWYRGSFKEHYSALSKIKYRPGFGRIVHSNTFNDEDNFKNALSKEKGEVLFAVQHGGGYGTHEVFCLVPHSEYIMNYFITWGWRDHESYQLNSLPLPSPALSRLKALRKKARVSQKIVFVGTEMSSLRLRIHSKPIGLDWLNYREQKVSFLSALSSIGYDNVYYRSGPRGTFRDHEFLQEVFPEIKIILGTFQNFHREFISARLCIVDYPGTSLHHFMAMNIPTIAFWNPDHWKLSRQSTPFFNDLERVGILYRSGDEAGQFVSDNFNQIESWWNSDETQAARLQWCNAYAKTSENWARDWFLALWPKNVKI